MLGIRGQFYLTLDDKGRLSLPAKIRDVLRLKEVDKLIVTNFKSGLWAYIEDDWVRYEHALMEASPFEQESLLFTRAFVAGASECEIDKQGRILIPSYLRQYGGIDLEKDAVVISVVDRLEIWSRERWTQAYATALENIDQTGGLSQLKLTKGKAGG